MAPATNLAGLRTHWRNDLIAGFSVALVALPLALGIAMAAGAPPISGLISSIVAGLLATFLRGSQVAINGPGNALIVIIASAYGLLGPDSFPHILGAVAVSGAVQVAFGVLRLGRLGDLIPGAVIQGMLSAIGLIIVGKQLHVMVGQTSTAPSAIGVFQQLPESLAAMNPFAALIGVVSVLILLFHPKVKAKLVHFVPAPLWVILVALPLALGVNALDGGDFFSRHWRIDEQLLVQIPSDLFGNLAHPDFSRIGEPEFWMVVATITLVGSIENIVSVKAVDKLDTYRRSSNLNRDLVGMGLSTIASAAVGGLPVLTVIARSSVNVNHGAKTGWSNFFHGAIVLVIVLFLAPVMRMIPMSALAGILVYTGFKLSAPHVVRDVLHKGPDHFLIFGVTLAATLTWGLLWGIFIGLVAEVISHLVVLDLAPRESFSRFWSTGVEAVRKEGEPLLLRVRGVANYFQIPKLKQALEAADGGHIVVDFSQAVLVDNTFLEYVHEHGRRYERANHENELDVVGLEGHRAFSDHPDALHVQEERLRAQRLTPRQKNIAQLASENEWTFDARREWDTEHLEDFNFFRVHPIEYEDTVVKGAYAVGETTVGWTVADVTFDEGALIPEVHHTTAQVIDMPIELPELIMEREELLDRVLELAGFQDIDFKHFTKFSRRFVLKGPDEASIRAFMTRELLEFFEEEEVYHVESTGQKLVVFKSMRLASAREVEAMLGFSERLVHHLLGVADGALEPPTDEDRLDDGPQSDRAAAQ